jgi:hypothetical protein
MKSDSLDLRLRAFALHARVEAQPQIVKLEGMDRHIRRRPRKLQSNRRNFAWRALAPPGRLCLTSRGVDFALRGNLHDPRLPLFALAAALALGFAAGPVGEAQAKGCLKGAVVGGVAGHYAGHHAVAGAIGGCIVGHHMAKVNEEKQKERGAGAEAEVVVSCRRSRAAGVRRPRRRSSVARTVRRLTPCC